MLRQKPALAPNMTATLKRHTVKLHQMRAATCLDRYTPVSRWQLANCRLLLTLQSRFSGGRLFQSHVATLGSQDRTVVQLLACSTIGHTHPQSQCYFSFLIQEMQILYVSDLAGKRIRRQCGRHDAWKSNRAKTSVQIKTAGHCVLGNEEK